MQDVDVWRTHTPFSDPGVHVGAIAAFPAEIGRLIEIVQGVLVHSSWLDEYGLDAARFTAAVRTTLPVARRLDDILARDPQPLDVPRPPERRSIGTCRDYALMLCAFLRAKGVPARVRCGFAAYFRQGWEDHWVTEYRDARTESWRLADAQIDSMLRHRNRIVFDPADMPRKAFLTAGEAWLSFRRAEADPGAFGHGETTGSWFMKVNVLRDHHVLNGRETSDWDRWREAAPTRRSVRDDDLEMLDDLAAHPDQKLVALAPDWLD
ncbi:transglutaminase [Devosia geojensis]|uniref:Transglutaminase n=1 Tax=Devosia geojensis TaxID=443610 RepID=A0A0F5FRH5_9HYPH|nr:transglutaminase domain-containing protein [Devosia geojensis]KKB11433.1 transglutaminase [Devosia geojensis]